jgi:drug/metabolite transporter (DMT)-like permease
MANKLGFLINIVLLCILALDWSSGYVIAGYVIKNGVHPLSYAFWQFLGALITLFLIQLIRQDLTLKNANLKYAIGCSLLGLVIPNIITFSVAKYIDSGILTVISNLTPLIVYPLAIMFKMEQLKKAKFILILIGMLGVVNLLPIRVNFLDIKHIHILKYFILSLFIPLFYAISMIFVAKFKPINGNVLNYSFGMLLIASIIMCPYTIINNLYYPLSIHDFNSLLILIEIILSTLGYILIFIIINRVGPVLFALVSPLTTVFGLFYAVILFKQKIEFSSYVSISIILFAIFSLIYINKRN